MTKQEFKDILKKAYRWGRDNGSGRSEKNFNDFLKTTTAKEVISKVENLNDH